MDLVSQQSNSQTNYTINYYAVMQCKMVNQIRKIGYVTDDKKVQQIHNKIKSLFATKKGEENDYTQFYEFLYQKEPKYFEYIRSMKQQLYQNYYEEGNNNSDNFSSSSLKINKQFNFDFLWPQIKKYHQLQCQTKKSEECEKLQEQQKKNLQQFIDQWKEQMRKIKNGIISSIKDIKDYFSTEYFVQDYQLDGINFPKGLIQYYDGTINQFDPQYLILSSQYANGILDLKN